MRKEGQRIAVPHVIVGVGVYFGIKSISFSNRGYIWPALQRS